MYEISRDIERILVGKEELESICDRLAAQITAEYGDSTRDLVMVVVLKGSIMFATDLVRRIPRQVCLEFMKVSSYGAETETSASFRYIWISNGMSEALMSSSSRTSLTADGRWKSCPVCLQTAGHTASNAARCWISPSGGRSISTPIMSDVSCRMCLWSGTDWTMTKNIAICRMSAC